MGFQNPLRMPMHLIAKDLKCHTAARSSEAQRASFICQNVHHFRKGAKAVALKLGPGVYKLSKERQIRIAVSIVISEMHHPQACAPAHPLRLGAAEDKRAMDPCHTQTRRTLHLKKLCD
jgi:hypothetical protein